MRALRRRVGAEGLGGTHLRKSWGGLASATQPLPTKLALASKLKQLLGGGPVAQQRFG